jgi:hypothetical protein
MDPVDMVTSTSCIGLQEGIGVDIDRSWSKG